MADRKIDGNDGAGNVDFIEQSTKRQHFTDVRYVTVRWEPYKPDGARQMKAKGRWQEQVGSGDYFRWQNCDRPEFAHDPETIESLTAERDAANARADQAEYRIVHIAAGLFPGGFDNNVAAIRDALRDKPVPAVLPLLPDMVDAATAAGVVVWWDNEAQEIKMAVTVQEAAKVLLDAFMRKDIDPLDAVDPQIEALAIKHSGNRGDPVIQLEIAEEFFCAALRSIAPPEA